MEANNLVLTLNSILDDFGATMPPDQLVAARNYALVIKKVQPLPPPPSHHPNGDLYTYYEDMVHAMRAADLLLVLVRGMVASLSGSDIPQARMSELLDAINAFLYNTLKPDVKMSEDEIKEVRQFLIMRPTVNRYTLALMDNLKRHDLSQKTISELKDSALGVTAEMRGLSPNNTINLVQTTPGLARAMDLSELVERYYTMDLTTGSVVEFDSRSIFDEEYIAANGAQTNPVMGLNKAILRNTETIRFDEQSKPRPGAGTLVEHNAGSTTGRPRLFSTIDGGKMWREHVHSGIKSPGPRVSQYHAIMETEILKQAYSRNVEHIITKFTTKPRADTDLLKVNLKNAVTALFKAKIGPEPTIQWYRRVLGTITRDITSSLIPLNLFKPYTVKDESVLRELRPPPFLVSILRLDDVVKAFMRELSRRMSVNPVTQQTFNLYRGADLQDVLVKDLTEQIRRTLVEMDDSGALSDLTLHEYVVLNYKEI